MKDGQGRLMPSRMFGACPSRLWRHMLMNENSVDALLAKRGRGFNSKTNSIVRPVWGFTHPWPKVERGESDHDGTTTIANAYQTGQRHCAAASFESERAEAAARRAGTAAASQERRKPNSPRWRRCWCAVAS
jgi:hypothetical protein